MERQNTIAKIQALISELKANAHIKGRKSRAHVVDRLVTIEYLADAIHEHLCACGFITFTRANINAHVEDINLSIVNRALLVNAILGYLENREQIKPIKVTKIKTYFRKREYRREKKRIEVYAYNLIYPSQNPALTKLALENFAI